ncbi:MAG TPA: hypothetical protein ENK77_04880 [Epsilonproteobacteria bacterium]|nr:hypothetical protein [Campylobacterota bacterium]HHH37924.1 hypothetical protein [Campylobacterota bacterium]
MSVCFVDEVATREILLRVTNVCGECYCDLKEGDPIYYDLEHYRYLCEVCYEKIKEEMNDQREVFEEGGLFEL